MLAYTLDTVTQLAPDALYLVLGHHTDQLRARQLKTTPPAGLKRFPFTGTARQQHAAKTKGPDRPPAAPAKMHKTRKAVILLAAGEGKRTATSRPKPLLDLAGKPMLAYTLDTVTQLAPDALHLVLGHHADQLRARQLKTTPPAGLKRFPFTGTARQQHAARTKGPDRPPAAPAKMHKTRKAVILLAAGEGKRTATSRPKPLLDLAGKPMLAYTLDTVTQLAPDALHLVLGHHADQLRTAVENDTASWPQKIPIHWHSQAATRGQNKRTGPPASCPSQNA